MTVGPKAPIQGESRWSSPDGLTGAVNDDAARNRCFLRNARPDAVFLKRR
jgi:hypothetical protein